MSDRYAEKDRKLEELRTALVEKGCTIYRQWGGNPAVCIFLPTLPGADGPRIVVKNYADFVHRKDARRAAYEDAIKALEQTP